MDNPPNAATLQQRINQNGVERKQLLKAESEMRNEIQSLLCKRKTREQFEVAAARGRAMKADLTRNGDEYECLIEQWAAEAFHDGTD